MKYYQIIPIFLLFALLSARAEDFVLRGTVTLGGDVPADAYLASNQTFTATNTFTKTIQGTATNANTVGGELPAALHNAANLTGTAAAIDGSAIINVDALTVGGKLPKQFATSAQLGSSLSFTISDWYSLWNGNVFTYYGNENNLPVWRHLSGVGAYEEIYFNGTRWVIRSKTNITPVTDKYQTTDTWASWTSVDALPDDDSLTWTNVSGSGSFDLDGSEDMKRYIAPVAFSSGQSTVQGTNASMVIEAGDGTTYFQHSDGTNRTFLTVEDGGNGASITNVDALTLGGESASAFEDADATIMKEGENANLLGSGAATDGQVLSADGAGGVAWEDAAAGTSTSDVQSIAWNSQRTPYQITSASTVTVLAAWGNLLRLDVAHSPCTITAEAGVYATNYTYDATLELYAGTNTIAWDTAVYTNTTLLDISTTGTTVLNLNKAQRDTRVEVRQ